MSFLLTLIGILYGLSGTNDPSLVATSGNQNNLYIKTNAPRGIFVKTDSGSTTNWLAVAGASSISGVANQIPYFNGSGNFSSPTGVAPNSLTWDSTKFLLGIENATPKCRIHASTVTPTSAPVDGNCFIFGNIVAASTIGNRAAIFGLSTTASGDNSIAFGAGTIATGQNSIAAGSNCTTLGNQSLAIGSGSSTLAGGQNSLSIGTATSVSGINAFAQGSTANASGAQSFASGAGATASGSNSQAFGLNTQATASTAHAEGLSTVAAGASSHAGGTSSQANGQYSFAHGNNIIAQNIGTVSLGDSQGSGLSNATSNSFLGRFTGGYRFSAGDAVSPIFGPNINFLQGKVLTDSNVQTTLQLIPTATDTVSLIEARVTAWRTGGAAGTAGDSASYIVLTRCKNSAGTVTANDITQSYISEDNVSLNATIDASGLDCRVRVTGDIDNVYEWNVTSIVNIMSI